MWSIASLLVCVQCLLILSWSEEMSCRELASSLLRQKRHYHFFSSCSRGLGGVQIFGFWGCNFCHFIWVTMYRGTRTWCHMYNGSRVVAMGSIGAAFQPSFRVGKFAIISVCFLNLLKILVCFLNLLKMFDFSFQ